MSDFYTLTELERIIEEQLASGDFRYVRCNSCGVGDSGLYAVNLWKKGEPVHRRRVRCHKCGLVYSNPQASETVLRKFYNNRYADCVTDLDETCKCLAPTHRDFFANLNKKMRPGKFLDVGCSTGRILSVGLEFGWDVYGVDISPHCIRFAREKLGLEKVQCTDLIGVDYPDNFFDFVFCWHVLEHVVDPTPLLLEIYRVMKPGAELQIGVPGVDDPIYYAERVRSWLKRNPPPFSSDSAHCFEFTASTTKALLEKAGFGVLQIKVYYNPLNELLPEGGWRGKAVISFFWYLAKILPNKFGHRISATAIKR